MDTTLTRHWWLLALRGVFAIVFGILTFISPVSSLFALVILFAIYAIAGGASSLVLALRRGRTATPRWGSLLFEGIVGLAAGVLTLIWPRIGALALLMVIAVWAVVTGITSLIAAVQLRKQIKGEWLLALNGILSIALGVLLFLFPGPGALALVMWIGAFALVSGGLLIALALRARSWGRSRGTRAPDRPLRAGRASVARGLS